MKKTPNYIQLPELNTTSQFDSPTLSQPSQQQPPLSNYPTFLNPNVQVSPGFYPPFQAQMMQTPFGHHQQRPLYQQLPMPINQVYPDPQIPHYQQIPQMSMMTNPQMATNSMEIKEHVVYNPQELYKIQSRGSQLGYCPHCRKYVQTVVEFKAGAGTWLSGTFIALTGCWMGCCLAPCLIEDCNDAVHVCPVCTKEVGRKVFLTKC